MSWASVMTDADEKVLMGAASSEKMRTYEKQLAFTPSQEKALEFAKKAAKQQSEEAMARVLARAEHLGLDKVETPVLLLYVRLRAPLIIHVSGETLKLLANDTHYRSGHENGKYKSGCKIARSSAESSMYGGFYNSTTEPFEMLKYGVLNIMNSPSGHTRATGYGNANIL